MPRLRAITRLLVYAVALSATSRGELQYDEVRTFSEIQLAVFLEGTGLGAGVLDTVEFTEPSAARDERTGASQAVQLLDDPNLPGAEGTVFPVHVESTPQRFDWGGAFFLRGGNPVYSNGAARCTYRADCNARFRVTTPGAYTLTIAGAAGPLDNLPPIGRRERFDYALYQDEVLVHADGQSGAFALQRVVNLTPGKSYRLRFSAFQYVWVIGVGPEGEPLESGVEGSLSVVLAAQTPAPCPGDLTGDSSVNLDDLLLVLGDFGSPGPNAAGDADADGDTDLDDLLIVLGAMDTSCSSRH